MSKRGPDRKQIKKNTAVQVDQVDLLLPELWKRIFSDPDLELGDILTLQKVSTSFLSFGRSREVQQSLVKKAFPDLVDEPEFISAPHQLLKDEFKYFLDRVQSHPEFDAIEPYLFESLCGDFSRIEHPATELSVDAENALYRSAAVNGHQHALVECMMKLFEGDPSHGIIRPFLVASLRGDFDVIEDPASGLAGDTKTKLYCCAAASGVQGAVAKLNQMSDKEFALKLAAEYGQLKALKSLLTLQRINFLSVARAAAESGNLCELNAILAKLRNSQNKGKVLGGLLVAAASKGHLAVVKRLLQHSQVIHLQQNRDMFDGMIFDFNSISTLFSEEAFIPIALIAATLGNHWRVADYLLIHEKFALLDRDIDKAARFAIEHKNREVFFVLLNRARNDLSYFTLHNGLQKFLSPQDYCAWILSETYEISSLLTNMARTFLPWQSAQVKVEELEDEISEEEKIEPSRKVRKVSKD